MGQIGDGFGSECHLLRFMGRHRQLVDEQILALVGGDSINWLDFDFNPKKPWLDAEIKGLNFLPADHPVHSVWKAYWPQRAGIHTWDAVGQVRFADVEEWLLVEAKANLEELGSPCRAKSPTSLETINRAFEETKQALGVPRDRDWLHDYYQLCNRVAALHFLNKHLIPARLLYIHFVGDKGDSARTCPQHETQWKHALRAQDAHVGLPEGHPLEDRIHKLFLPTVVP